MNQILRAFLLILLHAAVSYAAHPLITDDTGTQGKGGLQLELNAEYAYDKEREEDVTVTEKATEISTTLSYGVADTVDFVLGIPFQWVRVTEDGRRVESESGFADVALELKWRFYEQNGLSFALKPGISIPTGDDQRGLGTGRVGWGLFLIGSKETAPWAFHANVGYTRNENSADERENIWHASVAATVEVAEGLQLAANTGIETNPDRGSNTHPVFIIGGIIYSISENVDIDFGIKAGLNRAETDYAVLAGIAWRL